MAKKKAGSTASKAQKKAKAAQKVEKKTQKKQTKSKNKDRDDSDDSDNDLEAILAKIQRDWEDAHKVTEELVQIPSRRANATLTACPNGQHLWCIGGEWFSEDGKAHFYNDVFRYSPDKDEWRKFISPTCPGPRSAHAVAASPAGGGKLFLFGGEFSSLHQSNFFHYRDYWVFDIQTHSWDRIETKIKPSARSGHRMATWKQYIFLFGGFYDPGIRTKYLDDLWLFDTLEYKWIQVEFKPNELKPSPRSGFSFVSTPDGIILHGGYCKEYSKGKRPVGIMLEDTWFLRLTLTTPSEQPATPTQTKSSTPSVLTTKSKGSSSSNALPSGLTIKWERRKRPSTAYAPALRSGTTMTSWPTKSMGVMFGGVTDEDTNEETLESTFWNDMNGYQWTGKGRWLSLGLKKPKKKGAAGGKKQKQKEQKKDQPNKWEEEDEGNEYGLENSDDESGDEDSSQAPEPVKTPKQPILLVDEARKALTEHDDLDPDDPILTTPSPRYNAMLAVLRNTLYIFGGIYEKGAREYTLDDFHSIQLDKMDKYQCIKASEIVWGEGEESSDDEDDEGEEGEDSESDIEGDDEAEDEERDQEEEDDAVEVDGEEDKVSELRSKEDKELLRQKATAFMGVSKDAAQRSEEEIISTPLPGEALAGFYTRSKQYWAAKAASSTDNRGKMLRRDGFALAKDRYEEYKPILEEVEKILAEAGLDEEEMKRSAAAGGQGAQGGSRHRR